MPAWLWLFAAAVGLARTLPFLFLQWQTPAAGKAFIGTGLLPTDFLAYLAFARQVGDTGAFIFCDPFVLEAQSPRFLLLFHWVVGAVAAVGHLPLTWTLELVRIPLMLLFFRTWWWFAEPWLPERHDRMWSAVLVGLSGGVEGLLRFLDGVLPPELAATFLEQTWSLHGWNVFGAAYNPLWLAAMTLALLVLRPVLLPSDRLTWAGVARLGLGIAGLHLVHPYSALLVLAVCAGWPVIRLLVPGSQEDRLGLVTAWLGGLAAAVMIGALGWWQAQEPVYRLASANVMGSRGIAVFWYPVTFGVTGFMALRGAAAHFGGAPGGRLALMAWFGMVAMLHSSPILNGAKFLFHAHLPVCLLAAPVARSVYDRFRQAAPLGQAGWGLLLGLTLASSLTTTLEGLVQIGPVNSVPADAMRVVRFLEPLPPGNVLSPAEVGNLIPAFTRHRVYVGHWFLSPGYHRRVATFDRLTTPPEAAQALPGFVTQNQVRYVVVADERASEVERVLSASVRHRTDLGTLVVFELGSPP